MAKRTGLEHGVVRSGRGYGVRVNLNGKRKWLGSFNEKCAECIDSPRMCRSCDHTAYENACQVSRRARSGQNYHRETCDSFTDRWLEQYPRPKASTQRVYASYLQKFKRDFEGRTLSSVTRPEAREWAFSNRHRIKPVAAMFADALNEGLIEVNPWTNLRLPKSPGRKNLAPLTEAEVSTLAEIPLELFEEGHALTMRAAVLTLAWTGIRPSELFALEPRHLDIPGQMVLIEQGAVYRSVDTPKSEAGTRRIILPPAAGQAISEIPPKLGVRYVFSTPRGRLFAQPDFARYFNPLRAVFESRLDSARRMQLENSRPPHNKHLVPYELRHFCATYMLDQGLSPEDVAFQLGHSDSRLVQRLYGHPNQEQIRNRIRQAFRPPTPLRAIDGQTERQSAQGDSA